MEAVVEAAIERARAAGVEGMLLAGVEPAGWAVEDRLAARHPELLVSVGVHPQVVAAVGEAAALAMVAALSERLERGPTAAAVGEIGLDGLPENRPSLEPQERIFREQLRLARSARLPVALHVLKAHGRALEVMEETGMPDGGVIHSYSGPPDLVGRYLALGLHVSFAGSVCSERSVRARASATIVPGERLLVETDAPDQTPLPHRPAPNEPAFLVAIVEAVAQIRGESPSRIASVTAENARRLFRVPPPR